MDFFPFFTEKMKADKFDDSHKDRNARIAVISFVVISTFLLWTSADIKLGFKTRWYEKKRTIADEVIDCLKQTPERKTKNDFVLSDEATRQRNYEEILEVTKEWPKNHYIHTVIKDTAARGWNIIFTCTSAATGQFQNLAD